ncbi:hypothetical protein OROMI_027256 [Orobanche minor]
MFIYIDEWEMIISSSDSQNPQRPDTKQVEHDNTARCEWDFNLTTVISPSDTRAAVSDAIGVVEFDPDGEFLATGGIARKIRVYSTEKSLKPRESPIINSLDHAAASEFYMCAPARISSLKWRPGLSSRVIGSGDYDGVVTEYELERRVPIFERDEHGGRRVWSVDYSRWDPALGASGSDDGTMQMWDPRCGDGGKCLASVQPNRNGPSPVCCVEFNPFGGPIVAAGCIDRRIYVYDLRRMSDPVLVLDGHQKAVTYTRFLDFQTLISSSIDGCLMMWSTEDKCPIRTYKGHVNDRRFVGLSVWRSGGLLSCGSENNKVFVYDKRWPQPIWARGFESEDQAPPEPGFVSGVCWRQIGDERCMLVAGGSDGVLQAFEGERKKSILVAG